MKPSETTQEKRQRVPNVERSARTREKLIEATINCLYELGYHQTTTVIVAERAGVSRGAMLHQFPSKADLILATADRLAQMRGDWHRQHMGHVTDVRQKFLMLIDVLWGVMTTPSGLARIDLMISARSDPELADRINELNDHLDLMHKKRIWELAEEIGIDPKYRDKVEAFTHLYAATTRGLALDAFRPNSRKGAEKAIELLKEFQLKMLDDMLADIQD